MAGIVDAPAHEAGTARPGFLRAVWDGREGDAYGHLAVLSSMALALRALGKNREEAFKEAAHYWATLKRIDLIDTNSPLFI